jgi:hypothetical protein
MTDEDESIVHPEIPTQTIKKKKNVEVDRTV